MLFLQSAELFEADAQVHACIARGLPRLGIDPVAACNPGKGEQRSPMIARFSSIPGVEVVATHFGPRFGDRRLRALASAVLVDGPRAAVGMARLAILVRRRKIDVVHCTEKVREALFGYVVARLGGARLTIHLHIKVGPWISRPTRWVMHRADRLIAISEFIGQSAIDEGYRADRVAVALNAYAPQGDLSVSAGDRASVLAEFGGGEHTRLIIIVARINAWKGQRELLHAVSRVAQSEPDVLLLIVGEKDPNNTDDEVIDELRALPAELGIADRVRFTGFRTDVLRLIHASDVFAMPSVEEPFGLVYLEAMAAGVPVLAVDNGGTPEVVENGVTGLLPAPGDEYGLAENLLRLLRDPQLRARMGAAGQERVRQRFSPERLAEDFAAIVRALPGV